MYKLMGRKGTGSAAVEALLALVGAEYKVEDVERDAQGAIPAIYRRINPRGEVPSLILGDDSVMTESAAIMIYLADLHPKAGMAPAIASPERARYLRWMTYLATTLYMSDLRYFYPERYSVDESAAPGIKAKAVADMESEFAVLSEGLGKGPWFVENRMTALDIYAAMLLSWAPDQKALFAKHPNLGALSQAVAANPAVAKVWARHGM
ncbi:glutathione S-transferase family protein [Aestuariivirga sp.]|uniref:glutathione S-transferase family protein n=1 Tax=Aestuariivirga sp. TaxID=2650926 RepID=UPI0039E6ABAA